MAVIAGGRFQFSVGSGWGRDGEDRKLRGEAGTGGRDRRPLPHRVTRDGVTGPGGAGELVGSGQSRGALCIVCSVAGGLHQQGDGCGCGGRRA